MSNTLAPLEPGLMILQGNRLEDLRDLLTQWIRVHPLEPLENECILVQSNGIAQWLRMALARDEGGCGIAAALQVDLPGRFLWQTYRSVFDDLPQMSPFDKAPLTWRLYHLLGAWWQDDTGEYSAQLEPLRGFLSQDSEPRRQHQLAANIADLYDQYQVYRADWLQAWENGDDVLIDAKGNRRPLELADAWQPLLWRWLVADIQADDRLGDQPWARASRAGIHQAVIARCAQFSPDRRPPDLPRRVVVFGISSLPRQTLALLEALAPFTQILIFASNPCRHYWGDLIPDRDLLRREYRRIGARKIPADLTRENLHLHGHPLLASWGRQGRDYLHLLDEHDDPENYRERVRRAIHQSVDLYRDPLDERDCLLTQLQSDILELRPLSERQAAETVIDPEVDDSLQFLVAHSPQREVEILHDQLLATLEEARSEGRDLPPREILVMVPDINVYAPHIQAVFGRHATVGDEPDPRFIPFHIADQGQRGRNTLLIALEKLLELPTLRLTVSELVDLLEVAALRERYGLSESDLPRLESWIRGASIRWGLNAQQRADLGLPAREENTWAFGLRRLLLGFANGATGPWKDIEPHDEAAGLEAAVLGPLAQLLEDLEATRKQLEQPQRPAEWIRLLTNLVDTFFAPTSKADAWAIESLELQLERLEQVWSCAGLQESKLPVQVVRDELFAALDQPSLTQKFLGGAVNFATLMPMRAIPFTQVWLLGMNDGDYPRRVRPADFDLMARDYRPGDRSRREDDRYLFLEALLSAREKLVISWVGRSLRDNSTRPPSVLVGQLRDHIAAGWHLAGHDGKATGIAAGEALLEALTTEHPLQPFSQQYFRPDRDPRLFTYASEWRRTHDPATASLPEQPHTAWEPDGPISLKDLAEFLRRPVRTYYRRRLGIDWQEPKDILNDEEPFQIDGLDRWSLIDQVIGQITAALARTPEQPVDSLLERACDHVQHSGRLAVPPFGTHQRKQLQDEVGTPLQSYLERWQTSNPIQSVSIRLEETGLILEDSLHELRETPSGARIQLTLQPSRLHEGKRIKWHHLLRLWPAHLAAQRDAPTETIILGPDTNLRLPPLTPEEADQTLRVLLRGYRLGLTQLLPLPCKTAFAALDPADNPGKVYEGDHNRQGEIDDHPAFSRFWPDYETLEGCSLFMAQAEALYGPLRSTLATDRQEEESDND
ncbi:MAG: exodeoxyribonuclease V subunit gamma [Halothiobacillaceae bacterium]